MKTPPAVLLRSLAPLLLALSAAPLVAQEITWVETRFHRVYLNNGNFIDGHVSGVSDSTVHLQLQVGEMVIRKESIDRIELVKLRSIREKPLLDPPLKKPASSASVPAVPRMKSEASFPPAPASQELVQNVGAVLSRLKVAKPDQKDALIDQLAGLGDAGAYLASLLPTSEEETAYWLRTALMRSKDAQAIPYLIKALDSDKPYVQIHAITLLGILGERNVARNLRPFLGEVPPAVKAAAIDALKQLSDADSFMTIVELVAEKDDMIRVPAINASLELGRQLDRMDVVSEVLRRYLNGADGRVAKELLGMVGRAKLHELWQSVVPFLNDADPLLRRTSAITLRSIEAPEAVEAVVNRLQQETDVPTLLELTKAASSLKSRASIKALISLLGHSDENVVKAAGAALTSLTQQKFGTSQATWARWWDLQGEK